MLHEILFNATIPGACINAVDATKERDRACKRHPAGKRVGNKPTKAPLWAGPAIWVKFISQFSRPRTGKRRSKA